MSSIRTLFSPGGYDIADGWFQTRPETCEIDGVGIVTILNKETGPELLLQKQYRPPIDKVVIEVPAGLIDAGETVEECAVRELKEETGYVGVAEQTSSVMFNGEFLLFVFLPPEEGGFIRALRKRNATALSRW